MKDSTLQKLMELRDRCGDLASAIRAVRDLEEICRLRSSSFIRSSSMVQLSDAQNKIIDAMEKVSLVVGRHLELRHLRAAAAQAQDPPEEDLCEKETRLQGLLGHLQRLDGEPGEECPVEAGGQSAAGKIKETLGRAFASRRGKDVE